jgi:DNA-binding phage protein
MKTKKLQITDFYEDFAGMLNDNPEKLKEFEAAVIKRYEETTDINVILAALKVLAISNGNISSLARSAKIGRRSVYNIFKPGSNPTLKSFTSVLDNLGVKMNFTFSSYSTSTFSGNLGDKGLKVRKEFNGKNMGK